MGSGVPSGAGIVILAFFVVPVVANVLKSLTKAIIKGSMIAYQKARIAAAETIYGLEDMAAEAKAAISEKSEVASE